MNQADGRIIPVILSGGAGLWPMSRESYPKQLLSLLDQHTLVQRTALRVALSLQEHFHRAEHWIVVNGTAIVTRDDEEMLLHENESVFVPLGCIHRIENPGKIPLDLIEVQSGTYLDEDDIVRLQDVYRRA
jgi:mannose-6-phosphate isomerase-like protein (cupin superfamily)